jgi:hypothetical protein
VLRLPHVVSRRRFWIPAHVGFELALVAALVSAWSIVDVRNWLLAALASHVTMRLWSAVDFIPKALAFERADAATINQRAARRWTRRSRLRLPLDVVTCATTLLALTSAARLEA